MQGQSTSAESKVTSPVTFGTGLYKCRNCSRVFNSSRACGGHQIIQCKAREMRNKAFGPDLAALLVHHIPSDGEEEEKANAETVANQEGTGSNQNSPKEAIHTESKAKENNESVTNKRKNKAVESTNPTEAKAGSSRPNKKAVRDDKSDQLQPQPQSYPQKQPQPQLWTKDFLGEWKIIRNVANGVETYMGFPEKTTLNPAARDFWADIDDNLDLELRLCSRNIEKVDLELKLGL